MIVAQSLLLALIISVILAGPGIPAAALTLDESAASVPTRLAACFGLGYLVSAGIALFLTLFDGLAMASYLPLWGVVSLALWFLAVRRGAWLQLDVTTDRGPLLLGAAVTVATVGVHTPYLGFLNTHKFIYYLNGIQIANDGGVPSETLQYGESWPLASDKILLDCFSAIPVLLFPGRAVGPNALGLVAVIATAVGLWACALEFGLRYTAPLLPLCLLGSTEILGVGMTADFQIYRAENFARAVAFAGLAVGICAVRQGSRRLGVVSGVLFGAASGSHLIATIAVASILVGYILVRLVADPGRRIRVLLCGGWLLGIAALEGIAIRLGAGGDFGLEGARDPSAYARVSGYADPTVVLAWLGAIPVGDPDHGFWYVEPRRITRRFIASALGADWPMTVQVSVLVLFGLGVIVVAALTDRRARQIAATGLLAFGAYVAIALVFSWRFDLYVQATSAFRRLRDYTPIATVLIGAAVLDSHLHRLKRWGVRGPAIAACSIVAVAAVWMLPAVVPAANATRANDARIDLFNWIRTETPCNARLMTNTRTAGTFEGLTGRASFTEGMAPYLRPGHVDRAVDVVVAARSFYADPIGDRTLLERNAITHVVVFRPWLEPVQFPTDTTDLARTPGFNAVYRGDGATVYQVADAAPTPISPLLQGKYRHCETSTLP